jgi:hypothetical protein
MHTPGGPGGATRLHGRREGAGYGTEASERERRPARGAPTAFRSGGAAVRAWGEKAGSRPLTPCSETSVVPASYAYIGLLAYLWESA